VQDGVEGGGLAFAKGVRGGHGDLELVADAVGVDDRAGGQLLHDRALDVVVHRVN
jgi:hypothetical protein